MGIAAQSLSAVCLLVFLLPLCAVPVGSIQRGDAGGWMASLLGDAQVYVAVYYEALCPSSKQFIAQLAAVAESLAPIMTLNLYPYGNAHPSNCSSACSSCDTCKVWECNVTCQHGVQECKLNLAQACLLSFVPALTALPAIQCIENSPFPVSWCIANHVPDGATIALQVKSCMVSPLGRKLQEEMAAQTLSLSPPKQFVPWVTVDSVPLADNYTSIVAAVCTAYKARGGVTPPAACAHKSLPATAVSPPTSIGPLANRSILYTRCRILKVLGEVCIELYEDTANSTSDAPSLGVILQFTGPGLKLDIPLAKSEVCMTDTQLLELLLLAPQLQPFDAVIRKLIEARGFIPAEVFSECVRLYNMTTSGRNVSGCVALDSHIMCFKTKCLYKAEDSFGCFHRP